MILVLKRFGFSLMILAIGGILFAQTTPQPTYSESESLGEKLDQTKAQVDQFKNAWDKARLETTLYEQRAKRAYQQWVKASKTLKAKALLKKDRSDLELQLSVERRKLAFSQWQSAQLREASEEAKIKAISQDKDTKAIQDKIHQLETKLNPSQTPSVSTKP